MSWCRFSSESSVRIIVFSDLAVALILTIYRVTSHSLLLRRITDGEFNNSSPEYITIMKYSTVGLITAAVVGLAVELFLFFLLNNGVRSKNYKLCKVWVILRIFLLLVTILGSVLVYYVRKQYNPWTDGLMDLEKVYRLFVLLLVCRFMKEIYKGVSANTYECNSHSGNADGYPNGCASVIRSQNNSHSNF